MNKELNEQPEVSPAAKLWALVVSLIVVAFGVTWTWKVGQESNHLYHELGGKSDAVDGVRRILDAEGIVH